MANASLGTVAISMTLWLADWGAGHVQASKAHSDVTPVALPAPAPAAAKKTCHASVQAPSDDSDLEIVVCAQPLPR